MLNQFDKYIVYLDPETLYYLYLSYTKARNYPVMNKLYALLHEGYQNNCVVTPISFDQVLPFIQENTIDHEFLNMMGGIGQIQYYQRFTIRTLQLIRVINNFFDQHYKKPFWRDVFNGDPDAKFAQGFNQYLSFSPRNVVQAIEREKKNSQIHFFLSSYRTGKSVDEIAPAYYADLWGQYTDLIQPYLPVDGDPEDHMNRFLANSDIKDIPEFHIMSNILYPLIEAYGIDDVELGIKDDQLVAAETVAAYLPYCHFYVTTVDIAELVIMTRINEPYLVQVYDHNESSLFKLINDLTEAIKARRAQGVKKNTRTVFKKSRF